MNQSIRVIYADDQPQYVSISLDLTYREWCLLEKSDEWTSFEACVDRLQGPQLECREIMKGEINVDEFKKLQDNHKLLEDRVTCLEKLVTSQYAAMLTHMVSSNQECAKAMEKSLNTYSSMLIELTEKIILKQCST